LDEPTSALDAESESLVVSALKRVCAGGKRTCLIIAHRLSTVREADRIVVLSGGRVVEEGSAEQLANSGSIWSPLGSPNRAEPDIAEVSAPEALPIELVEEVQP
jgi:subfamily B ATP-binding cassette protein MsbA